jgi:hypothetical protein
LSRRKGILSIGKEILTTGKEILTGRKGLKGGRRGLMPDGKVIWNRRQGSESFGKVKKMV